MMCALFPPHAHIRRHKKQNESENARDVLVKGIPALSSESFEIIWLSFWSRLKAYDASVNKYTVVGFKAPAVYVVVFLI